jgi:hypothetical protein
MYVSLSLCVCARHCLSTSLDCHNKVLAAFVRPTLARRAVQRRHWRRAMPLLTV